MQISISQIVSKLGAEILNAPSDEVSINGLASLAEANQEDLSFFHHERYLNDLKSTKAGAVLVPIEFKEPIKHVPLLKVKSPSLAFNEIAKDLYASNDELDVTGIHETAIIGKGVRLDPESVSVGPYVVIGSDTEIGEGTTLSAGVRIGNNISIGKKCSLFPNVVVYDRSQIGNNVQVHGGTVIGSDGFGYEFDGTSHQKIIHFLSQVQYLFYLIWCAFTFMNTLFVKDTHVFHILLFLFFIIAIHLLCLFGSRIFRLNLNTVRI